MKRQQIKNQKTTMTIQTPKLIRGHNMIKPIFVFMLFCTSSLANAWVCPTSFSQIAVGDSIDQVSAVCGKPASETTSEGGYRGPQEWQYFVTINQPLMGSGAPAGATPSIKMSILLVNQKAINITVQGTSLGSTSLCGPTISIGDSDNAIEKSCGKPVFIQKQQQGPGSDAKPIEIIEYKYNSVPPNKLIFENGILKDRK
jgi:hypothetical protein